MYVCIPPCITVRNTRGASTSPLLSRLSNREILVRGGAATHAWTIAAAPLHKSNYLTQAESLHNCICVPRWYQSDLFARNLEHLRARPWRAVLRRHTLVIIHARLPPKDDYFSKTRARFALWKYLSLLFDSFCSCASSRKRRRRRRRTERNEKKRREKGEKNWKESGHIGEEGVWFIVRSRSARGSRWRDRALRHVAFQFWLPPTCIMNRYANPRIRIITHSCDIVFSHAVNRTRSETRPRRD